MFFVYFKNNPNAIKFAYNLLTLKKYGFYK